MVELKKKKEKKNTDHFSQTQLRKQIVKIFVKLMS